MKQTAVVFVHGFNSGPVCWDPLIGRLEKDADLVSRGFQFVRFSYETKIVEMNATKRIPTIKECGEKLADFLDREISADEIILVGHSMGGLVIQSLLAEKIGDLRGEDLAIIRSVILFATPNRGSTMLGTLRSIFSKFITNDQDQRLRVLDDEIAEMSEVIARSILSATEVEKALCPIPFRVFWGLQDAVVPKVSARGSFVEASPLPGGHSEILQCDPNDPKDERYCALRDALLNPVGHPSIYDIELFEVKLELAPIPTDIPIFLRGLNKPKQVPAPDNVAIRSIRIVFSKQNRCRVPYDQTYSSDDGFLEVLDFTQPNEALAEDQSEYCKKGQRFAYVFTPDRSKTFITKLRIYNGFSEGQRGWHNHLKANARYKKFRFTLDLSAYHAKGYAISPEPNMYFYPGLHQDHELCSRRVSETPCPYLESGDPWLRVWELADLRGGVVDLVWDVQMLV